MRRRIAAILGAAALIGASVAATTASAAPPSGLESYAAGSTATAAELTFGGDSGASFAFSRTGAVINSTPQAAADGAALLIAGTPVPEDAPAAAPGGPATNTSCALEIDLEEETSGQATGAGADLACVQTAADVDDDGEPSASSVTGETQITILTPGGELLQPLLGPVLEGLDDVTDTVIDGLCGTPLATLLCPGGVLPDSGLDLLGLLEDLVDSLADDTFVLAQVTLAPTASLAGADDEDGVTGLAGSNGATITLLPGIGQSLADLGLDVPPVTEALATISIGQALASVTRDPVTGAATTDGSAAQLVSVAVNDNLGVLDPLLDALNDAVADLAGNPLNCSADNPLADVFCIDLGEVRELDQEQLEAFDLDFGDGTVGVHATATTIRLLPAAAAALDGDLATLAFATATAAANATPVQDAPPPPPAETPPTTEAPAPPPAGSPPPEAPRDLPRTGGSPLPIGLLAGMAGLAVLGGALVRRSALS